MTPELTKMLKMHRKFSKAGLSTRANDMRLASRLDMATAAVSTELKFVVDNLAPAADHELNRLTRSTRWAPFAAAAPCSQFNRRVSYAFTDEIRQLASRPELSKGRGRREKPAKVVNRKQKKSRKDNLLLGLTAYSIEVSGMLASRRARPPRA